MNYLSLSSHGEIDAQALSLMGASVKDTGSIGEFGSGLKYAIATLLRHNVGLEVWSGLRRINIEVRPEVFRGQDFGVIWIDGQATSITTRTGPKWHVRDAIRELWSNAIDEGDASRDHEPQAGRSTFRIELVPEVKKMLVNWTSYFVHEVDAVYSCSRGRMLRQATTNYFRRGVWICEDRQRVGLFSYDFVDINLPESRRIETTSCATAVASILHRCPNVDLWEEIINHPQANESMEIYATYYYSGIHEKAFREAFHRRWTHYGNKSDRARIAHKLKPEHKVMWVDDRLTAVMQGVNIPHIFSTLGHNPEYEISPWPIGFEDRVQSDVAFLADRGVDLSDFNIAFAKFTNPNVIAQADMKTKTCLIGDRALQCDARDLRKALVEEWTHLEHDVDDHTVEQQHVYLELIVKLMEEK